MLTAIIAAGVAAACALLLLGRHLRIVAMRDGAGFLQRTQADLAMLFIFVSAARLRWIAIAAMGATLILARLLGAPLLLAMGLAVPVALVPRLAVGFLRQRWRGRLATQLPDALTLWAGLLRTGQAMAPALTHLASRQANPLGAELRLVLSQYRLGVGLDVAIARFRDRASVPDIRMLATLLRAQRDLGGNLADALDRLAVTLRNRLAMEARIRSLTAQGRLQGVVVGALPLLLAIVLWFMEPDAMQAMVTTRAGIATLIGISVLEVLGVYVIRRIVSIDV